ncbi:glutamate racemase [bacterium SCSIO 12696]|nr:glutamate racemase [bacterium SCSIO 12696]
MAVSALATNAPRAVPRVLVFDSGVGGLSVLAELRKAIPQCELVFACDNEAFPYGTKSETALTSRVQAVLQALIQRLQPDVIVVACNSASTLVLPSIRHQFNNPVVGVVPAIKPAASISASKCIGLLATPGTVKRRYTQNLIEEFASHCQVVSVGSAELVELAELKLRGGQLPKGQLQQILEPLFNPTELDTIVLACTHFPLLKEEMAALAPRPIQWIDSGEAIARRVHSLLPGLDQELPLQPHSMALFTAPHPDHNLLTNGLAQFGCTTTEIIEV